MNQDLLKIAFASVQRCKTGFVGAGAGGGDPAAAGGAPPPGGDPMAAAGGGMPPPAPPSDPAAGGGGGGGMTADQVMAMVQQAIATQGGGAAGGAGAASGAPIKPKIDVNVEIMQMKNLLAKVVDHLGIPVPAQDMAATPEKLLAMSQGQSPASGAPVGGAAGGAGGSAIPPIEPIQGAAPGMGGGGEGGAKAASIEYGSEYVAPVEGQFIYDGLAKNPPVQFSEKAAAIYARIQAARSLNAEANAV